MTAEEALNKYVIPALNHTWNEKTVNQVLEALERSTGHWHIEWNPNDSDTATTSICSCCGKRSSMPWGNYCKWCGAKMESEVKG